MSQVGRMRIAISLNSLRAGTARALEPSHARLLNQTERGGRHAEIDDACGDGDRGARRVRGLREVPDGRQLVLGAGAHRVDADSDAVGATRLTLPEKRSSPEPRRPPDDESG